MQKKKGLSPVIASVLLILLVVALAIIVFLWSRGFLFEQIEKFGKPVKELCKATEFNVVLVSGLGSNSVLEFVNIGDVNINSFQLKLTKEGNSEVEIFKMITHPKQAQQKEIDLKMNDGSLPEKIEFFPVLMGNVQGKNINKYYVCLEKGKVLKI
jgi:flagellin-like protein